MKRIAIVSLLMLSVAPSGAALGELTHLGVPSNRIVNLSWEFDESTACTIGQRSFFRILATGATASTAFEVPPGTRLIITHYSWAAGPDPISFTEGRLVRSRIDVHDPDGLLTGIAFWSTGVRAPDTTSSNFVAGSDTLTAGAAIAPGRRLCVRGQSNTTTSFQRHDIVFAKIIGYLVAIN